MAMRIYAFRVILFTLLSWSLLENCIAQSNDQQSRGSRRRLRNRQPPRRGFRGGGLPSELEQAYNEAASAVTPTVSTQTMSTPTTVPSQAEEASMSADDPWRRFIPSTPTASEVECHFEIYTRRRQGGRCIRLGGTQGTAICQSGAHFEFTRDCEAVLSAREAELEPEDE